MNRTKPVDLGAYYVSLLFSISYGDMFNGKVPLEFSSGLILEARTDKKRHIRQKLSAEQPRRNSYGRCHRLAEHRQPSRNRSGNRLLSHYLPASANQLILPSGWPGQPPGRLRRMRHRWLTERLKAPTEGAEKTAHQFRADGESHPP